MNRDEQTEVFLQEAGELLSELESAVLDLEERPEVGESFHRLFRAFHTLKGAAGATGFPTIASFSHEVESLLDYVRSGSLDISRRLIDMVLSAGDFTRQLLGEITGGPAPDPNLRARIDADLGALTAAVSDLAKTTRAAARAPAPAVVFFDDEPAAEEPAATESSAEAAPAPPAPTRYRITFSPDPTLLARLYDPAQVFEQLAALGTFTPVARLDAVPVLEALDPQRLHLAWDATLDTDAPVDAIRDAFTFVENDSTIVIEPAPAEAPVVAAAAPDAETPTAATPEAPAVASAAPSAAAAARPTAGKPKAAAASVRVASDKLDRLIQLVGELVINQARISQVARGVSLPELTDPVEGLERLVGELRDNVLGIRMMPIGETFGRFRRLVRDLSAELGKQCDLVTEGEETELDKTVLDQLADPLVHLIRNSLDHGLETPEQRRQSGKDPRGTLRLQAAHEGAHVVVTIADDGRGLDTVAIRRKAIERGLIGPEVKLSAEEIQQLIFAPGFSTAAKVSSVSGRGVGMDVVKRHVESLRGSVTLQSEYGRGTRIRLHLPLTLAIIDGLLVEVGGERLIVPMAAVAENVELGTSDRTSRNGQDAIVIRGELVPYLRLGDEFGFRNGGRGSPRAAHAALERVVIVNHGGARLGLLVDRIVGVHQTVIQSLGRMAERLKVVSGATILGDGRVALILDLASVVKMAEAKVALGASNGEST